MCTFLEDLRSEEGAGSVSAVGSSVDDWNAAVTELVEGDVVGSLVTLEGKRENAVVVSPCR